MTASRPDSGGPAVRIGDFIHASFHEIAIIMLTDDGNGLRAALLPEKKSEMEINAGDFHVSHKQIVAIAHAMAERILATEELSANAYDAAASLRDDADHCVEANGLFDNPDDAALQLIFDGIVSGLYPAGSIGAIQIRHVAHVAIFSVLLHK